MISVSIKPHKILGLQTKRGMLGNIESYWSTKSFDKLFITDGKFVSVEYLASGLKETLSVNGKAFSDVEVTLVLDSSIYTLLRIDIPLDTDKTAYHVFLQEQFLKKHAVKVEDYILEMFVREFENKKIGFVYALPKDELATVSKALELLDYTLVSVVPEELAYYTIFERTLRLDKQEYILYASYEEKEVSGYVYDTYGPLTEISPWVKKGVSSDGLEAFLNQKANECTAKVAKLNRIILSGSDSDKIRQDTFTKNVGVWTNPLKRIVPNFYKEYIAQIQGKSEGETLFPVLSYSDVFGGYVSVQESKAFPYAKIGSKQKTVTYQKPITYSPSTPMITTDTPSKLRFPKEIVLFIVIFIVTFGVFYLIANSRSGGGLSMPFAPVATETPTPEPTVAPPTPTPTVEVKRASVKIQVLNGTGVAGQANGVKTILESSGYESITTGNADKYDYLKSEVQIKKGMEYLRDTLLADIKSSLSAPDVTELDADETVDVIIIIGKDVK